MFIRPFYKDNYLVSGQIIWSDDVRRWAGETKPYFKKLETWMKLHWKQLPGGDYYIGPEGQCTIDDGAKMVNFLPTEPAPKVVIVRV